VIGVEVVCMELRESVDIHTTEQKICTNIKVKAEKVHILTAEVLVEKVPRKKGLQWKENLTTKVAM